MKKISSCVMPIIQIDRRAREPLHRQIYNSYRNAIVEGALRPGMPGASGAGGMTGAGGQGGKKEEDGEHKSAAYLEDDYSDDIVGELPRTVPPVIGMG